MLRKIMLAVGTALLPTIALAATIDVTDADIPVGGNVEWTADNEYVLNGLVFVSEGSSLTIQAGTVIKGKPGQGENASALVVARGGKIFAEGTADKPIIFTAEADDVSDPNDLPLDARGLWGGVIILGKASLNSQPGETPIEGIPTTEPRGIYGGERRRGQLRRLPLCVHPPRRHRHRRGQRNQRPDHGRRRQRHNHRIRRGVQQPRRRL